MKRVADVAWPALGLAMFLLAWQAAVSLTSPPPVRPISMALSASRADVTCVVIRGARGETLMQEQLKLDPSSAAGEAARLRTWIGSLQPTVAGLPPRSSASDGLRALLAQARHEFGGGMDEVVVLTAADTACAEASQRAALVQQARVRQPTWLPGPIAAGRALGGMAQNGELLRHVVASVFRVTTGVVLALMLGIPFGLAIGSFAWLHDLTNAVIQLLRPISPIAWLPAATLALGGGDLAAVFLIFLAAFFPLTVSTAAAAATVDLKYRRSAMNFGVHGIDLAWRVIVPATLPAILTAVRIAVGIAWVVVVAAEMLGVESGLGYLVLDARNQLRYDRVAAAMIAIGCFGFLIDLTVRRVERAELAHRGMTRDA